jgi:hypothetical protein
MLQAILGYLNQKHMSSMEDKREGRLYVDNRHARGRSAPVEGTHQEPMVPPTWRHTRLAPSPGCAGVAGLRRRLGRTTMPQ